MKLLLNYVATLALILVTSIGVQLGDVNQDGSVDLFDIQPFIDVLSADVFQEEADTNRDGVVNFFDVAPFIDILSGERSEPCIVPLFDETTILEPETTVDTPAALITYLSDRGRDRHAREYMFNAYDHYLSWYWEQRTMNIEIIDRVGRNGGTDITFN